jgi:hypothetical protein
MISLPLWSSCAHRIHLPSRDTDKPEYHCTIGLSSVAILVTWSVAKLKNSRSFREYGAGPAILRFESLLGRLALFDAITIKIAKWQARHRSIATQAEELINADIVTGNYFDVLGVRPLVGRAFLPEEDRTTGTNPGAVISHRRWQRRLGADPSSRIHSDRFRRFSIPLNRGSERRPSYIGSTDT